MGRIVLYTILLLAMAISVSAAPIHHSEERVVVRLQSYNAATNEYTFWCGLPTNAVSPRTWSVREDDTNTDLYNPLVQTSGDTFTTNKLTKEDLYHIGCQTNIDENGQWKNVRGDFHIDLRPEALRTITVQSSNALNIDLTCLPQEQANSVSWLFLEASSKKQFTFQGAQRIQYSVERAGLWDIECWANGKHQVLPIEFFSSGAAYVPNANGCVPNEPCPNDTPPTCTPAAEVCDGADNDCDSQVDEGNVCTAPPTNGSTCYNSVQNIPASCTGGSITSDTWNGCRQIVCSSSGSSMQILACDKSGKFEMYKQSKVGTAVSKICIGETCMQNEGFVPSSAFPICTNTAPPTCTPTAEVCDDTDNDCDGQIDENNVCTPSGNTCYNSVKDIPLTCAGTVTQDTWNGCRTVVCTSGSNNVRALACDKSGFFEVYRQSVAGTAPQLCFGNTCLTSGFARSDNFPICAGTTDGNQPPQPPTWIEPSAGKDDVDVFDFHIHANNMVDAEGDAHKATDFELWDVNANQRVWHSTFNTNILYHIHNGDGTFVGNLADSSRLNYNTDYQLRARFHTADGRMSAWSNWRTFRTKQQVIGGSTAWTLKEGYKLDLIAKDISVPVNIAMAPALYNNLPADQQPLMYVTNLYGQISVVLKDGSHKYYATNLLNYETFGSLPGSGENGVIGIYVDPTSGDLYVSMTYEQDNKMLGKVEKFVTNDNGDGYTSRQVLLSGIPTSAAHQPQQITRGPDGKLYMSTGDADDTGSVQDPNTLNGKILRFNDDGSKPTDNPWPGTYTYAMGFRNAFGTDWRPGTSELWISNNGPDSNDGVYKVTRGFIGGWKTSGDTRTGTAYLYPQTVAPTALVFNRGNTGFPAETTGSMYLALSGATYSEGPSDVSKRIQQFTVNPDGTLGTPSELIRYTGTGYSAPIGAAFGSDGLYFTDLYGEAGFVGFGETKGAVYRISPGNGGNSGGSTDFSAGIAPARWYPQGMNMVWECKGIGGSGTYKYDYVFGDGQSQYGISSASVYHTYPGDGSYTASCTVRDQSTGKLATATTTIALGNVGSGGGGDNCHTSTQTIPVTCTGGTVTSDIWNGCRQITCASGSNSLSVLACDKNGNFEIYKQSSAGAAPKICFGTTCMQNEGFKSGSLPYCAASNGGSGGNSTPPPPAASSVDLKIAPWYPQGQAYVFHCDATGFTPTSYDWNFGDGNKQTTSNKDVYHHYASGSFNVECTARGSEVKSDTLQISVS